MKSIHAMVLCLCLGSLMACSGMGPHAGLIGQDRGAVTAKLGAPAQERTSADGARLVYPNGPLGKGTYVFGVDAKGIVTGVEDVLIPANFVKIAAGMGADEVEALIGPTRSIRSTAQGYKLWMYPFHNSVCQLFMVEMSAENKVLSTANAPAPECESISM